MSRSSPELGIGTISLQAAPSWAQTLSFEEQRSGLAPKDSKTSRTFFSNFGFQLLRKLGQKLLLRNQFWMLLSCKVSVQFALIVPKLPGLWAVSICVKSCLGFKFEQLGSHLAKILKTYEISYTFKPICDRLSTSEPQLTSFIDCSSAKLRFSA